MRVAAGIRIIGFFFLFVGLSGCTIDQEKEDTEAAEILSALTGNRVDVQLIVKEPEVINPMTISLYGDSVLYVSESYTYRYGVEGSPSPDSFLLNPIKRLEIGAGGRVSDVRIVASGFDNPVMGLDIFGGKIYATCLNELFSMDIMPDGSLENKQILVTDSADPWNPFGMYRVRVGPDGKLWLAMADHPESGPVDLTGTDGSKVKFRGQTGGFVRCNLDGSELEMVVQGFRAPFGFDFDPWGNLWAISNGEGSPNIYVKVIPGMDYGYHSRDVSYEWLAGKTQLSPPVTEMSAGANTEALHYYSSQFPASDFWGSIIMANWGSHGENPDNRDIKHFVPVGNSKGLIQERKTVFEDRYTEADEIFLSSADPMFRPVSMRVAPDGGLYLADWHGMDDESNVSGRIFKLTYKDSKTGSKDFHAEKVDGMDTDALIGMLSSANQYERQTAQNKLVERGEEVIPNLKEMVMRGDAFTVAQVLWTLVRIQKEEGFSAMAGGLDHGDSEIRSMILRQLRYAAGEPIGGKFLRDRTFTEVHRKKGYFSPEKLDSLAGTLLDDPVAEVRTEAALSLRSVSDLIEGLLSALEIAESKKDLYRIGFELGRYADFPLLVSLYTDDARPDRQWVSKVAAQTSMVERPETASEFENWDLSEGDSYALEWVETISGGGEFPEISGDKLLVLNFLTKNHPEPNEYIRSFLLECLSDPDYLVQMACLEVLRNSLFQDSPTRELVLELANRSGKEIYDFLKREVIYTLAHYPDPGPPEFWVDRISGSDEPTVIETLRSLRQATKDPLFTEKIWPAVVEAGSKYPALSEEILFTGKRLGIPGDEMTGLTGMIDRPKNKAELSQVILEAMKEETSLRRGKWSFDEACGVCHSVKKEGGDDGLGPNLATIGSASRPEYLIESILEPSKILKTGYKMETIETHDGKTYTGQVVMKDGQLIIRNLNTDPVVLSSDAVKSRISSNVSPMPPGLDNAMTVRELADVTAYLQSLKGKD